MDWRPDYDGLKKLFQSLELKILDKGTTLYRGTFEGTPNEDWTIPILCGIKYFSPDMECATRYAQRKDHPTCATPHKSAKGLLFCITLTNSCKVLEFPKIAETYAKYVQRPVGEGTFNLFEFERKRLMPIMRSALGNDVFGYVAQNNVEALLDLDYLEFRCTLLSSGTG